LLSIPSINKSIKTRFFSLPRNLQESAQLALAGQKLPDGIVEKALITHFELLNLVPTFIKPIKQTRNYFHEHKYDTGGDPTVASGGTKWRRVGLVSGKNVHLDTIVWPGGDIVVSGLSARSRTIFRVVTALSPPFVMESDLDEDGQCLRGLPCHRLTMSGKQNLTLMFNAIETRDRLEEDALDHGNQVPQTDNPDDDDGKPGYR
jgi:glutamate receptor ionotropic, NMDA 3A